MIQLYKATITDGETEVIGYVIVNRKYIGNGAYNGEKEFIICVNELSMPKSNIRGCFKTDPESIEPINYKANCSCEESEPFINSDNNYTPYCRWCGEDFKLNNDNQTTKEGARINK